MKFLLPFACAALLAGSWSALAAERPNVLLIMIDDLNDWTGPLNGHPQAKTPHLDRLAARGMTFTRAYAASPLCGPSRAALLYGRQPHTSGAYGHQAGHDPRTLLGADVVSLPRAFQQAGYRTVGGGKIFHGSFHDARGWDDYRPKRPDPSPSPSQEDIVRQPFPFGPLDVADAEMDDMQLAAWAEKQLLATHEQPFFLAVGFFRPHLPWHVPRAYFDAHPLGHVITPQEDANDLADVPTVGRYLASPGVGFNGPANGDHEEIVRQGNWSRAVQAYLAAGTFADACVGVVLDALHRSGREEDTIVIVLGDHGWHLGEKAHWRKHALWERATRTTLLIHVPGKTPPGSRCERTVGLMDVYPTLAELCGLPVSGLEARSLAPLLREPDHAWAHPAVSVFGPGNFAVRTERWRYIRYLDGSEELYDHMNDAPERRNLASNPELQAIKAELAAHLPKSWAPDPAPDSVFNVLADLK